jgi:ribose transport system ATP-binding protein
MAEHPRLEMRDIRKRFGATVALDGVSVAVRPGEVHGLVGQNGAGKSTLMKILSGALQPDSGAMLLDGQAYAPASPIAGRRRGVAMIYQELSLAPHMMVYENILLGMEPRRAGFLRIGEMKRRAREALTALGHGELDLTRPVAGLSPATQQVIEIARALAIGCRVLVLDEPTSSLTRKDVAALFDLIRRLKAQGHAIVYISHFLEEVRTICDRFTILRDGKTVGGGDAPTTPPEKMVEMMVGRSVDHLYPRSQRPVGEVVLELDALSGMAKPRGASFALRRGEVLGIAGLIGAGRTELLRAIFGLDPIKSGRVKVAALRGKEAVTARTNPSWLWKLGVGMLSEDRKAEGLALTMSIQDNITLSDMKSLGPLGFIGPRAQQRAANRWADVLALKRRSVLQPAGDLSGGNQQKCAVARLLHHGADVLLLDEPTRGIDVGSKAAIYQLIDELAVNRRAVLIVSSYYPELLGICDRIAVMSRGVLGEPRPVNQWNEQSLVLASTGQEAAA